MSKSNVLLGIVSKYLTTGYFDVNMRDIVKKYSKDGDLKADELKNVYSYIAECQQSDMDNGRSELSIREMKNTILKMIGATGLGSSYQSTVSRVELKAIYNFIVALPSEVFLGETNG